MIEVKDREIATKDREIAELKTQLQGQFNNVGGNYDNMNERVNAQSVNLHIHPNPEITNANNSEVAVLEQKVDDSDL